MTKITDLATYGVSTAILAQIDAEAGYEAFMSPGILVDTVVRSAAGKVAREMEQTALEEALAEAYQLGTKDVLADTVAPWRTPEEIAQDLGPDQAVVLYARDGLYQWNPAVAKLVEQLGLPPEITVTAEEGRTRQVDTEILLCRFARYAAGRHRRSRTPNNFEGASRRVLEYSAQETALGPVPEEHIRLLDRQSLELKDIDAAGILAMVEAGLDSFLQEVETFMRATEKKHVLAVDLYGNPDLSYLTRGLKTHTNKVGDQAAAWLVESEEVLNPDTASSKVPQALFQPAEALIEGAIALAFQCSTSESQTKLADFIAKARELIRPKQP